MKLQQRAYDLSSVAATTLALLTLPQPAVLARATEPSTCGEILWEQSFESPSISSILQTYDGESFFRVADPPGCVFVQFAAARAACMDPCTFEQSLCSSLVVPRRGRVGMSSLALMDVTNL